MEQFFDQVIFEYSWVQIFLITYLYFLFLYFVIGFLFRKVCTFLYQRNIISKISNKEVSSEQVRFEIRYSMQSILIFGFSGLPVVWLIRLDIIQLLPNNIYNVLSGVLILTLWNEFHFFLVHRLMHVPFLMKKVHYIHHRSLTPTTYSVYSFHWLEAFLLSTVPLTITPFIPFSPMAIFLYPLASILLNFAGHCNYRFGKGTGPSLFTFGTRHAEHHYKGRKNYGFATNFLDWLNSLFKEYIKKS